MSEETREELDSILGLKIAAIATVWPYDKYDPRTEAFDRAICVPPASARDHRELADDLAGLVDQVDEGLAESLKEVLNVLNVLNQKLGEPTCTDI